MGAAPKLAVLALSSALLLPTSGAAPSDGSFTAAGPLSFAGQTGMASAPFAVLQNQTASMSFLRIACDACRLMVFESHFVGATTPALQVPGGGAETRDLSAATIEQAPGNSTGFFGIHPGPSARLGLETGESWSARAQGPAPLTGQPSSSPDRPEQPWYREDVAKDNIDVRAEGRIAFAGPGDVKVAGPDVRIRSADTRMDVETGLAEEGPGRWVWRWIVVESENVTVAWSTGPSGAEALVDSARVQMRGMLLFVPYTGALRDGTSEYVPTGSAAQIEGRFDGDVATLRSSDAALATLSLSGDLRATTLEARSLAAPARVPLPGPQAGLLAAGALACVAAGAGGFAALRRGRPRARPERPFDPYAAGWSVDECVSASQDAFEAADWELAVQWTRHALRMLPTSVKLRKDEATYLLLAGRVVEAHDRFAALAGDAVDDGEVDFWAAETGARIGKTDLEVEAWAVRALEKTPKTIFEMDGPACHFRTLLDASPRLREAKEEAYLRIPSEEYLPYVDEDAGGAEETGGGR